MRSSKGGKRCKRNVRIVVIRKKVRIREARIIDPSEGPVERVRAACIVCVDVGGGGGNLGLFKFKKFRI